MGSDPHFFPENHESNEQPESDDPPASVVFMQMMRQAAVDRTDRYDVPDIQDEEQLAYEREQRQQRDEAIERQRRQRTQRRRARRHRTTVGVLGGILRTWIIVLISGGLIATILSWGTSPQSLDTSLRSSLEQAFTTPTIPPEATALSTPNWLRKIGIVSGHRGHQNDPGAVCLDGLTENEINFAIAQRVILQLRDRGYNVDLLEEFDDRLEDYQAAALVSLHSNDCRDYNQEFPSGFIIAHAAARPEGGNDTRLVECIAESYLAQTGLERRFTLTDDMTNYHTFREINSSTPAAILEMGFMLADRELLTMRQDVVAQAITDGVLCFLEPKQPEPTITPLANGE